MAVATPCWPGPGLGNDPLLAHPLGQQPLAQGVVDLVGPGVVQVFPFEIDLGAPQRLRQMLGEIQRRGPAHVIFKQPGQLLLKLRIPPDPAIRLLQLQQGRHQGLRDETSAELTEMAVFIW